MVAIGIFLSCLTESQVIAAVSTFGVSVFLMVVDQLASITSSSFLMKLVEWLSFNTRYTPFFKGIFDLSKHGLFPERGGHLCFLDRAQAGKQTLELRKEETK